MLSDNGSRQMINRLRMRQVALLLAIDAHNTLRDASEFLGMSQSAASKMLGELEDAMGQPLLQRDGRRFVLNEAGKLALQAFHELHASLGSLHTKLQYLQAPHSLRLRLGCSDGELPHNVVQAIANIAQIHGGQFSLSCSFVPSENALASLRDGKLDVYVGLECLPSQSTTSAVNPPRFTAVEPVEFSLLMHRDSGLAHDIGVHCTTIKWDVLQRHPWIVPCGDSTAYSTLQHAMDLLGVTMPEQRIEASTLATALHWAESVYKTHLIVWPQYLIRAGCKPPEGWVCIPIERHSHKIWGLWSTQAAMQGVVLRELLARLERKSLGAAFPSK
jgi:DNA-binding transcriptional LysR family regulator